MLKGTSKARATVVRGVQGGDAARAPDICWPAPHATAAGRGCVLLEYITEPGVAPGTSPHIQAVESMSTAGSAMLPKGRMAQAHVAPCSTMMSAPRQRHRQAWCYARYVQHQTEGSDGSRTVAGNRICPKSALSEGLKTLKTKPGQ